MVARATGLSRPTIMAGLRELQLPAKQRALYEARVRRPGGERRPLTETDPGLLAALEALSPPEWPPSAAYRGPCCYTSRNSGSGVRPWPEIVRGPCY